MLTCVALLQISQVIGAFEFSDGGVALLGATVVVALFPFLVFDDAAELTDLGRATSNARVAPARKQ